MKKYAQENPEQFLALQDDPEKKTKITIKQALDAGIISYLQHEHKIVWGKDGSTCAKLERGDEGDTKIDCFYAEIKASKNGDNVLKSIQTQLKAAAKSE